MEDIHYTAHLPEVSHSDGKELPLCCPFLFFSFGFDRKISRNFKLQRPMLSIPEVEKVLESAVLAVRHYTIYVHRTTIVSRYTSE